jgi:hypothetical protein
MTLTKDRSSGHHKLSHRQTLDVLHTESGCSTLLRSSCTFRSRKLQLEAHPLQRSALAVVTSSTWQSGQTCMQVVFHCLASPAFW